MTYRKDESSRRVSDFGESHAAAAKNKCRSLRFCCLSVGDTYAPHCSAKNAHLRAVASDGGDRIGAQEACRERWIAMYGARAELASRGGVMWL